MNPGRGAARRGGTISGSLLCRPTSRSGRANTDPRDQRVLHVCKPSHRMLDVASGALNRRERGDRARSRLDEREAKGARHRLGPRVERRVRVDVLDVRGPRTNVANA